MSDLTNCHTCSVENLGRGRRFIVEIPFTSSIGIPDDVLIRELDGESVILDLNSEGYFGLDEIGTSFWSALSESDSVQEAYNRLLGEFDVDEETLRTDLVEFASTLVERGMMRLKDA